MFCSKSYNMVKKSAEWMQKIIYLTFRSGVMSKHLYRNSFNRHRRSEILSHELNFRAESRPSWLEWRHPRCVDQTGGKWVFMTVVTQLLVYSGKPWSTNSFDWAVNNKCTALLTPQVSWLYSDVQQVHTTKNYTRISTGYSYAELKLEVKPHVSSSTSLKTRMLSL
jgi:hypothetical protein